MAEIAAQFGGWLANEITRIIGDKDTLNVLVIGHRSLQEVHDIVGPLARKLKSGITLWARGAAEIPEAPPKVRLRKLDDGQWDLIVFSPYMTEVTSQKILKTELVQAFTAAKPGESTRILICVSRMPDFSPHALRSRLFGHSPPPTEEIRGSVSEEDLYNILEGIGFAQLAVGRLNCKVDLSRFFKSTQEGYRDLSTWLRVPPELCKRTDVGQLKRLCEKGTEEVVQPKSVFAIPLPAGFEREERAQPSRSVWWPTGDFKTFHHYGLERWGEIRKSWESAKPSESDKKITKVPKLSARELNSLVDTLTTNHERIELPCPMRLDDLLDVLVDVWDSLEDNA